MNKIQFNEIPSVRLTAGMYALCKLACAGVTFIILSLLMLWVPESGGKPQGWPVTVPYAVYAYGLTAALVADALIRLLSVRSQVVSSLLVYAVSGFGAGLWLFAEQGGTWWWCSLAGVMVLLLFYAAELMTDRVPLLLPVFALFAPLIYLLLQ